MYERFERRKLWRRSMAFLYIASFTVYLGWRLTIIDQQSLSLSIAFYVAELLGFVLGLIAIITTWNYSHHDPLPCPPNLSVDVFVTTYKEPLHVIRRTAIAAKAITYPHETWILDDGKRDDVKALADELGLRYLRRPDNKNAKAGNLNYGFAHSKADFVMSIDADHIVMPHALDIMLGFFVEENVALVQTPQDYYNIDAFQYMKSRSADGLWHDQSSYYNVIEPCGDKVNAATCIGTGVVYRRSAIDSIGGIPTVSITEDIHTSLKLQKRGYRVVFLNEPIAYGLAEASLPEFFKVRHRWAQGNIHAVEAENIRFCKGLDWRQRLQYMALELIYIEGWQQLLLFCVPVVALIFGQQPFQITIFNILIVMTFPFFAHFLMQEGGCGFTRFWASEILAMARWPIHIVSVTGLFRMKMPFRSSSKYSDRRVNWRLMAPQLTVVAASLGAVAYGIWRLHRDFRRGPLFKIVLALLTTGHLPDIDIHARMPREYTADLVAIAGFWALYSVVRGGYFIQKVLYAARNNHQFVRFRVPLPVIFAGKGEGFGCISSISEEWMSLVDYRDRPHEIPGGTIEMSIVLPAGPLTVKVDVDRTYGRTIEGRLIYDSIQQRDTLASALYSVDWHREFLPRNAYFPTFSERLLTMMRVQEPSVPKHTTWHAALYRVAGEYGGAAAYGIVSSLEHKTDEISFITFKEINDFSEVKGEIFTDGVLKPFRAVVTGREPLSSLASAGHDGATVARYRIRIVA